MHANPSMLASQRVVQVCLFLVAAIALFGGALQMLLGEPQISPRLDNVHRFMAGVYFSTGFINLWAALTIRSQGALVYLLALGVLLARYREARFHQPSWPARTNGSLARLPHSRNCCCPLS